MLSIRIQGTKLVFGPIIIDILLDRAAAEIIDPGPYGPAFNKPSR